MRVKFFEAMRIPRVTHNALSIKYRGSKDKRIPFIGKSSALHDAEDQWEAHLAHHGPSRPLEGALILHMRVAFYREDIEDGILEPMIDKPDHDNLTKTIQDAMERLGWFSIGDQQIFQCCMTKCWANTEGIEIDLTELPINKQTTE